MLWKYAICYKSTKPFSWQPRNPTREDFPSNFLLETRFQDYPYCSKQETMHAFVWSNLKWKFSEFRDVFLLCDKTESTTACLTCTDLEQENIIWDAQMRCEPWSYREAVLLAGFSAHRGPSVTPGRPTAVVGAWFHCSSHPATPCKTGLSQTGKAIYSTGHGKSLFPTLQKNVLQSNSKTDCADSFSKFKKENRMKSERENTAEVHSIENCDAMSILSRFIIKNIPKRTGSTNNRNVN